MPISRRRPRPKIFGPGRGIPLDREAKVRVRAYASAWNARNRQPRQHRGPITRTGMDVLEALLWGFHNSRDGRCFPSYETIADKAACNRSSVHAAIHSLESANVLTWDHRIARITRYERGRVVGTRVLRTSNGYIFRDPLLRPQGVPSSESENQSGTQFQEKQILNSTRPADRARKMSNGELFDIDAEDRKGRDSAAEQIRQLNMG